MQYRLRTLLILLAAGPPLLWLGWLGVSVEAYTLFWLVLIAIASIFWLRVRQHSADKA